MFTITFKAKGDQPLYQQLYRFVRESIANKTLQAGDRLPSKRKLAAHLQVSNSTVENAYAQLIAEGYIMAKEKKGYYIRHVEAISPKVYKAKPFLNDVGKQDNNLFDLKTNAVDTEHFPFSVWTKLMRESLREDKEALLQPSHPQGDWALRVQIARYLKNFRSMDVDAQQIVLGAGMEYLLGLLVELLPAQTFALENPCYPKLSRILQSKKVAFWPINLDNEGLCPDALERTNASVVFLTPTRQFPLGIVMTASRRMQLLKWAAQSKERYLIEDDYDSEYRYQLKPIPPLHSLDRNDKVIYLNTFARTLAPSLRIGYMVLPEKLLKLYQNTLLLYSCTVSRFEQACLQRFMQEDHYERHLNRMRLAYRARRDILVSGLSSIGNAFSVKASEAGLHVIVTSKNGLQENLLLEELLKKGIKVYKLSDYYLTAVKETNSFIVGYGGMKNDELQKAVKLIVATLSKLK